MNSVLIDRLQVLDSPQWHQVLRGIKRGFEKEALRVDKEGMLAKTLHPSALGSSLTHPMITTDYSEALLEFITPPTTDLAEPFQILSDLHRYTYQHLNDEILWASSMPCRLPTEKEIPIAEYGTSNLGRLRHIYRQGLGLRYGRIMQTIAGIHYNFSLSEAFWKKYHQLYASTDSLQAFTSAQYLGLVRNSLRYSWLLPLLFGASPAVCDSFFKTETPMLKKWDSSTLIGRYATSLRLSDLGYHNTAQSLVPISYNTFEEFLQTMHQAVHTPFLAYSRLGVQQGGQYQQLSDSIFQVEDEHYALVRPKRVSGREERMLAAMLRDGIEYIEIRALDINPFIPIGIEPNTVYLLDAYLIACLLMESPPLTDVENRRIAFNHKQVVTLGRRPQLTIMDGNGDPKDLQESAVHLIELIGTVAELLDKTYQVKAFSEACRMAKQKLLAPEQVPSARILQEMGEHGISYFEFAWRWSVKHGNYFKNDKLSPAVLVYYTQLAEKSKKDQRALESENTVPFNEYLSRYLAT